MYNIIPIILMLLSSVVIIFITIKKFPALNSLDVENMPAERETRFKEKIISERLKRVFYRWSSKIIRVLRPVGDLFSSFTKSVYGKLLELRDSHRKAMGDPLGESAERKNKVLMAEARLLMKDENYEMTEKKLIEAIGLDHKNKEAFWLLGEIYFRQKNYGEAKQTFDHILKMDRNNDPEIRFELAKIMRAMNEFGAGTEEIIKALEAEPNNPRYLDIALEMGIMNKDKVFTLEMYRRLKKVNPGNSKLDDFKKRMDEI